MATSYANIVVYYLAIICYLQTASGILRITSYQNKDGPRSIDSEVSVTFEMSADDGALGVEVKVTANTLQVAYVNFVQWSDTSKDEPSLNSSIVDNSNLRYETGPSLARKIIMDINPLLETHNKLNLLGEIKSPRESSSSYHILNVSACELLSGQEVDSNVTIAGGTTGHYRDKGTCDCFESQQLTFIDGKSVSNVTANCGQDTEWKGCESVQCWSGPQVSMAVQLNYTSTTFRPFQCNFTDGYPTSTNVLFRINDTVIPDNYRLQSYDHEKELSCSVVSNFTIAVNQTFASTQSATIKVYFPPENPHISEESPIIIEVNKSKFLNYSVSANPERGNITVTLNKTSEPNSENHANFVKIHNHMKNTRHIYEYAVKIDSNEDYGTYQICASTQLPIGTDCVNFSICNFPSPHSSQPDATTFPVTTDAKKQDEQGIPATIIGAIVAGAILLVLIVAVGFVLRKRRGKALNTDHGREERLNELYGSAQYQTPATENPVSVKQEKANVLYGSSSGAASGGVVEYAMANPDGIVSDDVVEYATSNPDVVTPNMTESTSTAEQPCSSTSDVYAQINKKKGKLNHGYNKEIPDAITDTSAVTYTVVDKPKKRKKDEVPEVYATVNKPRTKG